jgi:hypothetical protein
MRAIARKFEGSQELVAPVEVNGIDVCALVDTGAQQSPIQLEWVESQPALFSKMKTLSKPRRCCGCGTDQGFLIHATVELSISLGLKTLVYEFIVVPGLTHRVFLGWDLLQQFGVRVIDVPVHTPSQSRAMAAIATEQSVSRVPYPIETEGIRLSDEQVDIWAAQLISSSLEGVVDHPASTEVLDELCYYGDDQCNLDAASVHDRPSSVRVLGYASAEELLKFRDAFIGPLKANQEGVADERSVSGGYGTDGVISDWCIY